MVNYNRYKAKGKSPHSNKANMRIKTIVNEHGDQELTIGERLRIQKVYQKEEQRKNPYINASNEVIIEEVDNIKDDLKFYVNQEGQITTISLKNDVSKKEFFKEHPDMTKKDLLRLFDEVEKRKIEDKNFYPGRNNDY